MVPTAWQDEALARDGVSREVPCSALKGGMTPRRLGCGRVQGWVPSLLPLSGLLPWAPIFFIKSPNFPLLHSWSDPLQKKAWS